MAKKMKLTGTVYVVSGNASTRLTLKRQLESKTLKVIDAGSGAEMIQNDRDFVGNLLVADTALPDMPITELLQTLREKRRLMKDVAHVDYIPSILLAAPNERFDDEALEKLGVVARLSKPLNLKGAKMLIAKILSGELKIDQGKKAHLGIMDPEERTTQYLTKLLAADDLEITPLSDQFDLMSAAKADPPLNILLVEPLSFPNGATDFLRKLKGDSPDLDIIVLTAYADEEEKEAFNDIGVHEIIFKPLKPADIRKSVRELVASKE